MTYLELVNRVLLRLREDEVADLSADYSRLIATFLGEIHAEMLEAHDWSTFDETIRVNLTSGVNEYDLSAIESNGGNVDDAYAVTSLDSQLRYIEGAPVVDWLESSASTQGQPMRQLGWQAWHTIYSQDSSQSGTQPCYFALRQDGDGWRVAVWPTPTASGGQLRMQWWIPETAVDVDEDAVDRVVLVPNRPLVLGALYLALNERGEEIGEPGNVAESRFYTALGAAKESDILNSGRTNRYEFHRE